MSEPDLLTADEPAAASVSTQSVRELMKKRYPAPEWALLEEVAPHTGGGTGYADAVAIDLWRSSGHAIHGFEIKTSRSLCAVRFRGRLPSATLPPLQRANPSQRSWWGPALRRPGRVTVPPPPIERSASADHRGVSLGGCSIVVVRTGLMLLLVVTGLLCITSPYAPVGILLIVAGVWLYERAPEGADEESFMRALALLGGLGVVLAFLVFVFGGGSITLPEGY